MDAVSPPSRAPDHNNRDALLPVLTPAGIVEGAQAAGLDR